MASIRARILDTVLRVLQVRNIGNHLFHLLYPHIASNSKPSRKLRARHAVTEGEFKGRNVYEIAPKEGSGLPHIFYLHGGAYFSGFLKEQWDFIDRLVTATGCSVTAPDYPLAPKARSADVYAMVIPLYEELVRRVPPSDVVILGDSSGGGLGLGLVQILRDKGDPLPRRLILSAPWLDVTMVNLEIKAMERDDPFLGIRECIIAGQRYAAGDDATQPRISPIYGRMEGLCPIHLFIGTYDLMLPDCRKLRDLAAAAGTELHYHEYDRMIHDWVMLRLPESKLALEEMVGILRS